MPPRNRDPCKPKGRTSAYAFFVKDRRAMYQKKGMQVQFTEFSRECADLWKQLDEDGRVQFVEQADEDRERYQREMADYKPPSDEEGGRGHGRRRRKKKDPNMPKRSMSGFMFFSQDKRGKLREQNPSASVGDIAKQLGAAWKIMTAEQKAPYEKKAKRDRRRYEHEMELFRKGEYQKVDPNVNAEESEEDDDEDED